MSAPGCPPLVGVIGGSGLYDIDGLSNVAWRTATSPFGAPSDKLMFAELDGQPVVFLPRHGRGHRIPPGGINYRANIDALKRAGVTDILSVSAVGSLREDLPPGAFVIVDQFIDRTFDRKNTFFGEGLAAHVSMARPACRRVGAAIRAAADELGVQTVDGGTYMVMEGPQFSTGAESELHRMWGCDVIGMTNMPEAKLAREAEMCYATIAMVTDFDCWRPSHDHVTVDQVVAVMRANADQARALLKASIPALAARDAPCPAGCHTALDNAIITKPEARDPELASRLDAVAGRVLG